LSWTTGLCPECPGTQFVILVRAADSGRLWLRCVGCHHGLVRNFGDLSPAPLPLSEPAGLPDDAAKLWNEIRRCPGVRAYTATVMPCRKILLHVAVEKGLPPNNDKDRAPTFAEALEYLEAEGFVTVHIRPWVERIKDFGNDANHEIPSTSAMQANDVATFTYEFLRLTYDMPYRMGAACP
jgi:Domain of unknown function (DUF4145)